MLSSCYHHPHHHHHVIIMVFALMLAKRCNSNEFSNSQDITLRIDPLLVFGRLNFCPFLCVFELELEVILTFRRSNISAQQILILVFLSVFQRYLSDIVHWKEEVWNRCFPLHCVHFHAEREKTWSCCFWCQRCSYVFYGWTNFRQWKQVKCKWLIKEHECSQSKRVLTFST